MILSKVPINAGVLLLTEHTYSKISQYLSNRDTPRSRSIVFNVVILTRKRVVQSRVLIQHRSKGIKTHDLTL
jgi:hypothetical protein